MTNVLRPIRGGVVALAMMVATVAASAAGAAEDFSRALSAEDFAAAGLGKLTPEELARLDALVRAQQRGELDRARSEAAAKAREETATKVRAETAAQVKAELTAQAKAEAQAANPKEEGSLLHRLRVKLTPGTEIEYATVETQLVGPFRGYAPGRVLTLSNGQQWQVIDGSYWSPKRDENKPRKVIIEPGVMGSFFLQIEDGGRPKVKIVKRES